MPADNDTNNQPPSSFLGRSLTFARRLAIFYFFFFALAVSFGIYYYKFVPEHESELNDRAFRILNRLTLNIETKYSEIKEAADNSLYPKNYCPASQRDFLSPYHQFVKNTNAIYDFDQAVIKRRDTSFYYNDYLVFRKDTTKVPMLFNKEAFLNPIFQKRTDLFSNFIVLYKHPSSQTNLSLLYSYKAAFNADTINIDSVLKINRNSDQATITNVVLKGKTYRLFLRPFSIDNHRLMLGGVIEQSEYTKKIKSLPTPFITGLMMFILLSFISLPFIKIYMLSPKEHVSSKDVVALSLAIFIGSGIVFLIIFYLCISFTLHHNFNYRLKKISDTVQRDINKELTLAGRQMDRYADLYDSLWNAKRFDLLKVLCYYSDDKMASVDSLFKPTQFKNIHRVLWMDTAGKTLAKWNAFNFFAPPTGVKDYQFFKQLKEQPDTNFLSVYPGYSNTTNEFLVLMGKQRKSNVLARIDCKETDTLPSYGISMGSTLSCTDEPVLPMGYEFCVIDNKTGEILIHSDSRHSLSENFYEETNFNPRITNCIQYKNSDPIDNITLYGKDYTARVLPITSQDFSLITLYDENIIYDNLFRLMHFSAEGLLYLYLFLGLCILLTTYRQSKPSKLSFKIYQVEWIRPSIINAHAYKFTSIFFSFQLAALLLLFAVITVFDLDIRSLFYVTVIVPFYALWAFVSSRKRDITIGNPRNLGQLLWTSLIKFLRENFTSFIIVLVANWALIQLMQFPKFQHSTEVKVIFFIYQAFSFLTIWLYHSLCWTSSEKVRNRFSYNYIASLYSGMLLLGVVPVTVLITYGFQAEKIQFSKKKELFQSSSYNSHINYFANKIIPDYKDPLKKDFSYAAPAALSYFDSLKYRKGIYLAGHDSIWKGAYPRTSGSARLPDEPYGTLMDDLFLITSSEYHQYTIKNQASDSSWKFIENDRGGFSNVELEYRDGTPGANNEATFSSARITNPWQSLYRLISPLKWILILGIPLFLFGVRWLLRSAVRRLFLIDYFSRNSKLTKKDDDYLVNIFKSTDTDKSIYDRKEIRPYPIFCKWEWVGFYKSIEEKEEYILAMATTYKSAYEKIWNSLSDEEKYFLYDFGTDEYTNYKDTGTLVKLLNKGILEYRDNSRLRFFSQSFRHYVKSMKGSENIIRLKEKYAIPGVWETFRIPVLSVLAIAALFLVFTQEDFSHKLGGFITSVTAFIPLLLKLGEKMGLSGRG